MIRLSVQHMQPEPCSTHFGKFHHSIHLILIYLLPSVKIRDNYLYHMEV